MIRIFERSCRGWVAFSSSAPLGKTRLRPHGSCGWFEVSDRDHQLEVSSSQDHSHSHREPPSGTSSAGRRPHLYWDSVAQKMRARVARLFSHVDCSSRMPVIFGLNSAMLPHTSLQSRLQMLSRTSSGYALPQRQYNPSLVAVGVTVSPA